MNICKYNLLNYKNTKIVLKFYIVKITKQKGT